MQNLLLPFWRGLKDLNQSGCNEEKAIAIIPLRKDYIALFEMLTNGDPFYLPELIFRKAFKKVGPGNSIQIPLHLLLPSSKRPETAAPTLPELSLTGGQLAFILVRPFLNLVGDRH